MLEVAPHIRAGARRGEGDAIIKLAVLAVGGQGGGVLADWIVDVAERNGYLAQSTSVAGVAQRTGATIYYIEMCRDTGRRPVFALSPSQGDVDILIAAELMEAGRAVMRGFVTPDRTTLIASSHRIAAVSEKIEPGDGRASSEKVQAAAEAASRNFVAFDMEKIALDAGSVISASLLGALAGSGALPFPRESYEAAISASERGVKQSLAAFAGACDRAGSAPGGQAPAAANGKAAAAREAGVAGRVSGPGQQIREWASLKARADNYPEAIRDMAGRGLKKVVDFQDLAYGREYLDRLDRAVALDDAGHGYALSLAAAKHLANAMCYDDVIRVADLKTRSNRSARVRRDVGVASDAVLHVTEYFHPRIEEFCGTMPVRLGRWIEARPRLAAFLDRRLNRGRRIRTDGMVGFALLWAIGGLRHWRRQLLRHQAETEHLERWYGLALDHVGSGYAVGSSRVDLQACKLEYSIVSPK